MVQADELSRDAILEAIAQGRFYASQGPRFWIEKKDNSLIVHSTPVKAIVFSRMRYGRTIARQWGNAWKKPFMRDPTA